MEPITAEKLASLFLFEKPHLIRFEYRQKNFKNKWMPAIRALEKAGKIKLLEKNTKTMLYKWVEQTINRSIFNY